MHFQCDPGGGVRLTAPHCEYGKRCGKPHPANVSEQKQRFWKRHYKPHRTSAPSIDLAHDHVHLIESNAVILRHNGGHRPFLILAKRFRPFEFEIPP